MAKKPEFCRWCGRQVLDNATGRRRRYCKPSCRQRAYEQRHLLKDSSLPDDAVVLSAAELVSLADRLFSVRCAAEDVATAVSDGASGAELGAMCTSLVESTRSAERWR